MQDNPEVFQTSIKRFEDQVFSSVEDILAVEEPLEISIAFNNSGEIKTQRISITMRTPGNDEELAAGFLFTEGIIKSYSEIDSISHAKGFLGEDPNRITVTLKPEVIFDLSKLQRNFYTTSSCGVCGKASIDAIKTTSELTKTNTTNFEVGTSIIENLPDKLKQAQSTFKLTGGLHASALFSAAGDFIALREDVGRHNALDKLIGKSIAEFKIPLDNYILLLSGRASFELLQKSAMAGIKMVCAVGAPSSLAVQTAQEFGITLIGFLKAGRFNIYSVPERVS